MADSLHQSFTVLGANGFIGGELVSFLKLQGYHVKTPDPRDWNTQSLGNVIYCIGVTSDFRKRPLDVVESHITLPLELMRHASFETFLYLSSTRIYEGRPFGTEDESAQIKPGRLEDIYNASKLMGESICLHSGRQGVRVARLSNVVGGRDLSSNFLSSVIRDAIVQDEIVLGTSLESKKDYVYIDDVVSILPRISKSGKESIYNIASGFNLTNQEIVNMVAELTGCAVSVLENAVTVGYPTINIDRIRSEFDFRPRRIVDCLPDIVAETRKRYQ